MRTYLRTFTHLRSQDFVDLLDGLALPKERSGHLQNCPECRTTFDAISELHNEIADRDPAEADIVDARVADVDWMELRSAVRDRLLSHAVKRSSTVQRWTGWKLTPAAAWGLGMAILISGTMLGGLWHYRTAHVYSEARWELSSPAGPSGISPTDTAADLSIEEVEALDAEALAWPQIEIFASLNELESGEAEVLRELISLAVSEDSLSDQGIVQ